MYTDSEYAITALIRDDQAILLFTAMFFVAATKTPQVERLVSLVIWSRFSLGRLRCLRV